MHKKRRMELGYPIITVEKDSQVCAIHKKNRMELGRASITNDNDSKVCAMNKNIRIVVNNCTKNKKNNVCPIQKRAQWRLDEQK